MQLPHIYTFAADTLGLIVGTLANHTFRAYLNSGPDTNKTIIHDLMKIMSAINELYMFRQYITSILVHFFHKPFEFYFQELPALVCSLMGSRLIFYLFVLSLFLLVMAKTTLIVNPTFFHALDHEKVANIVVGSLACLAMLDLAYSLLACGNVCATTTTLLFVSQNYSLYVEATLEHCHHIPITTACIILGVICQIGSMIYSHVHNRQTRSCINVYNLSPNQQTKGIPSRNPDDVARFNKDDSTETSEDVSLRNMQGIKNGQLMPGNKTASLNSQLVRAEIHRPPEAWIQELRKSSSNNEMDNEDISEVHLEMGTLQQVSNGQDIQTYFNESDSAKECYNKAHRKKTAKTKTNRIESAVSAHDGITKEVPNLQTVLGKSDDKYNSGLEPIVPRTPPCNHQQFTPI